MTCRLQRSLPVALPCTPDRDGARARGGVGARRTPAPGGDTPLQISHRARAAAPGEVVLVDIRAKALAKGLEDVQAQWLSQTVLFYQVETGWWQGLAPIDVGVAAGRYTLAVRARTADGRTLEQAYPDHDRSAHVPGPAHHRRAEICRSARR